MTGTKTNISLCWKAGIAVMVIAAGGLIAQDEWNVQHAECFYFGPKRAMIDRSSKAAEARKTYDYSVMAADVTSRLARLDSKTEPLRAAESDNVIDKHLVQVWRDNNITPAARTNDFEFIRRVTLDLTGRIPTATRVQAFVAELSADKRTKLVDELLASSSWVDKWAMYFGDLYKNTTRTTQVVRFNDGRNAFHQYLTKSLTDNKPYDKLVTELITSSGANSYEQGDLNYMVGGFVTGGPVQDIWDQMAVNTAQMFLGVGHLNCLMCHDGRRHMEPLSLWGKTATRYQAYQMSAFFARTELARTRLTALANPYYWSVQDNTRYRGDYNLNTTTGNRPSRTAVGTVRTVTPEYIFTAGKPRSGENYRAAYARELTSDFQFARATVNYMWKEFMTKAFVEPVDQFDLARLDPDNPPGDDWQLQPNQPRLLNALAQYFIDQKYDLKALMRTIVLSDAYQLSSRYEGQWNVAWENSYARHLPRRLWAEEIADAVTQSSGVSQNYAVPGMGNLTSALKLPDVTGIPGEPMRSWLDSFFRGNRDTEQRRAEGSTLQVLNLMNDNFVMSRTRATGTGATSSLARRALTGTTDDQLISMLFINVLSRYPTDQEKTAAFAALRSGNRQQKTEDLLWSLYNKVDFFFNY